MRDATQDKRRQVRSGAGSVAIYLPSPQGVNGCPVEGNGAAPEHLNIGADEKSSRIGYIYELTWRPRGWSYIGATCDIRQRITQHRSSANRPLESRWGVRVLALLLLEQHGEVPIQPAYYYKRNRWTPCPFRPSPPPTATWKESLDCPAQLSTALQQGRVLVSVPDVDLRDITVKPLAACPRSELKTLEAEWIRARRPQLNDSSASVYHYHYG